MSILNRDQIRRFDENGFLVAGNAVTQDQLYSLRKDLGDWVDESRRHSCNYGSTLDQRPRFDLEPDRTAKQARLRRVNNPAEISESYRDVAFNADMVDMVTALIGPDVKFLHDKINLKSPKSCTRVGFHQDFSYVPHTNADVMTALLFLDDMGADNGCLLAVAGSHRQGQLSLWRDGVFTGEVEPDIAAQCAARATPITGSAGDVCLMHAALVHGSNPNHSNRPRGLYICMYSAADAFLLRPNSLPNRFEGKIVRGAASRFVRLTAQSIELPEDSHRSSFFQLQEERSGSDG